MKKLRYVAIAVLIVMAFQLYKKASVFDANNPEVSLNAMMYLIPDNEDKRDFLKDFLSVAIDDRGSNLHGLSREEIHALAHNGTRQNEE